MRICHIIEATAGGSARIAAQLAASQISMGHEVTLLYSPLRADNLFLDAIAATQNLQKVSLLMQRSVGLHDLKTLWQLIHFLYHAKKFDIIHSHSSKAGALARVAGIFFRTPKQLYSPHAFYSMAPGTSHIYGWYEKILSWFCDAIITVSPFEKKHAIEELGIAPKKLHVVINGVETGWKTTRAQARNTLALQENAYILGFVGRLVAQKNPQRLMDSFKIIARKLPEAWLVILGDGIMKPFLEQEIKTSGLENRIKILSGYDARMIMPAFDSLLCSSDYEGFAVVFLEALAAGVPIVSTPVGGTDEAIINGKTGKVSDDFTADSLAKAALDLATLPLTAKQQMHEDAKQHANNFTVDIMSQNTLAIYYAVLTK